MEGKSKFIRNVAIFAGVIISLFVFAAVVLLLQRQPVSFSATLAEVQAKTPFNPDPCLSMIDDVALRIPSLDQSEMFSALSASITDIPAGTKISANAETYDGLKATGTVVYADGYGTYNFAVEKNDGSTKWRVTSFVGCK